ncbi:hypothetical protein DEO72_LG4g615 [Vigna unguiculata]|uniref:Uncharacterized protein n=1 Tax=Vigna unguiculata TaxID=3917 RepID=A0A4D6LLK7_VIGUN|nr:hypothetical protein DEO72_LG4g615 [Vigna unguiculata]
MFLELGCIVAYLKNIWVVILDAVMCCFCLVCANSEETRYSRPSEWVSHEQEYQKPSMVLVQVVAQATSSSFEREVISFRRGSLAKRENAKAPLFHYSIPRLGERSSPKRENLSRLSKCF